MARSISRSANSLALAAALFLAPSVAHAQDRAAAEELFQLGKTAMAKKDFAHACDYFRASLNTDFALGTLLNLATCHEQAGQIASAWAAFRQLEDRARRATPPQKDRAEYARHRAELLHGRLSRIRILLAPDLKYAPDLVVKIDDVVAQPELFEVGLPVDIGKHTLTSSATGRISAMQTVTVYDEKVTIDATITLKAAPEPPPKPPSPREPAKAATDGPSSQRTFGLIAGGAGVALVATGAVFGVLAVGASNEASCAGCLNGSRELGLATDAYDRANAFGWVSNITIALGAIGIGAGTFLFVTAPRVAIGPSGVMLGGTL